MNLDVEKRKKEILSGRIGVLVIECLIVLGLYYFDYDFNNTLYNGILFFLFSILLFGILRNDRYYIETGMHPSTEVGVEEFELFSRMHPFITLYNKLVIIVIFIMLTISTIMIIISFF